MSDDDTRGLSAGPTQIPQDVIRDRAIMIAPQNRKLGIEILKLTHREALFRLPYRGDLIGNPDTGVLHGGVITTLLDAVSGGAVFCALAELVPVATLDLRIDYLKPAVPGTDLFALARCYKTTRHIAFVRAWAYHETREDAIATASSVFMLSSSPKQI